MQRSIVALLFGIIFVTTDGLAQQVELDCNFEPGTYCSEAPIEVLDLRPSQSCGQVFYQIQGRLAFLLLYNHGPIQLEVRTLTVDTRTRFPLYVGMLPRASSANLGCTTTLRMRLLFAAQGLPYQCGGIWESIGPLDLTSMGVGISEPYHLQLEGFFDGGGGSVAIAEIRVTTLTGPQSVVGVPWSNVKLLYKSDSQ